MNDAPTKAPKVSLVKLFNPCKYLGATSFGGGVVAYLQENYGATARFRNGLTTITSWRLWRLDKPSRG